MALACKPSLSPAHGRAGRASAAAPRPGPRPGLLRRASTTAAAAAGSPVPMPRWESIFGALTLKHGLTASVTPAEAARLVARGSHVLIDVRPPAAAAAASPAGAVSVPLYIPYSPAAGGGPGAFMKAALLTLNGVSPTVQNRDFVTAVVSAAGGGAGGGGKAVLVVCETGGSLVPTPQFAAGKPSRSLQAAFRLLEDGRVKGVGHVQGGVFAWDAAGLPIDGEYDGADAGRTNGVVQGQGKKLK